VARRFGDDDRSRRDRLLRQAARGEAPKPPRESESSRKADSSYRSTPGEPVVPPYPSRVDLHAHSRRSDGVLEPIELVTAAAAVGVRILALADHDTLAGVRELRGPNQPPLPLDLLPAVEINSIAGGFANLPEGELHILGLGVDVNDDFFEANLKAQRDRRAERFNRIVDRLGQLGYPIDKEVDQLLATQGRRLGASLGRPQIARCLVEARYAPSVDEAMKRLLVRGRPAYVPREGLNPAQAISVVRAAGGLPVLAHFAEAEERRALVAELIGLGLGGLEVHYRHFDRDTVAALARVAEDLRLIPTGGSDYHGDGESYADAHAALFVPDEDAITLYSVLGRRTVPLPAQPSRP
jgi:predicted metal-dependent phosphoesterase TrpH